MVYECYLDFHGEVSNLKRPRNGLKQRTFARSASQVCVDEVGDKTAEGTTGPGGSLALGPLRYIQLPGSWGPKGVHCTIAGRTEEDSDNDASGGTAASMDAHVLLHRSDSLSAKYGVHVKASRGKRDAGSGLFAAKGLPSGRVIVVPGPIFETVEPMQAWIDAQQLLQTPGPLCSCPVPG